MHICCIFSFFLVSVFCLWNFQIYLPSVILFDTGIAVKVFSSCKFPENSWWVGSYLWLHRKHPCHVLKVSGIRESKWEENCGGCGQSKKLDLLLGLVIHIAVQILVHITTIFCNFWNCLWKLVIVTILEKQTKKTMFLIFSREGLGLFS